MIIFDVHNSNNFACEVRSKKNKLGKSPKKDSNIYDINNFVVQNFSSKIIPKKEIFKIPTPIFQELPHDFYCVKTAKKSNKTKKNNNKKMNEVKNDFNKKNKIIVYKQSSSCNTSISISSICGISGVGGIEDKELGTNESNEMQEKFEKENNIEEALVSFYLILYHIFLIVILSFIFKFIYLGKNQKLIRFNLILFLNNPIEKRLFYYFAFIFFKKKKS